MLFRTMQLIYLLRYNILQPVTSWYSFMQTYSQHMIGRQPRDCSYDDWNGFRNAPCSYYDGALNGHLVLFSVPHHLSYVWLVSLNRLIPHVSCWCKNFPYHILITSNATASKRNLVLHFICSKLQGGSLSFTCYVKL